MFRSLAIINNLLHGSLVRLLVAQSVLLKIGFHYHDVKRVGGRLHNFCFGGQFYSGGARGHFHGGYHGDGRSDYSHVYKDGCGSDTETVMVTGRSIGPGDSCNGGRYGRVVLGQ